jgi:hypothetical protein
MEILRRMQEAIDELGQYGKSKRLIRLRGWRSRVQLSLHGFPDFQPGRFPPILFLNKPEPDPSQLWVFSAYLLLTFFRGIRGSRRKGGWWALMFERVPIEDINNSNQADSAF